MDSYFAMLWDSKCEAACRTADQIVATMPDQLKQSALEEPGLYALDLGAPQRLPSIQKARHASGDSLVLMFGKLFRHAPRDSDPRAVRDFSDDELERIFSTSGESILTEFWGNYVALLHTDRSRGVISSPTSILPCFYLEHNGVLIAFSHLERCPFLNSLNLSINYEFVRQLLVYDKIQNGKTGLNEVNELIGGYRVTSAEGRLKLDIVWDPRTIAARPHKLSMKDAADQLRFVVEDSVATWASAYDRVAVDLSGGLDSTIVLSCLASRRNPESIFAVHQVLSSHDATEVHYAREAAAYSRVKLMEVMVEPNRALPDLTKHPPSVRPFRQFLEIDFSTSLDARIMCNADVFFTGQGGDHLFYVSRSPLGFADHLRDNGLTGDTLHQLLSAARLSGKSIWSVLGDCSSTLFKPSRTSDIVSSIQDRGSSLNKFAFRGFDAREVVPEWARSADAMPPAKSDQIGLLMHLFQVRKPFVLTQSRQLTHPLISQPLIEFCLQTPVYQLAPNGVSRGLVRQAFLGSIPDAIRLRMAKGEASQYFMGYLTANKQRILEALVDGELAAAGFLSNRDISAFFDNRSTMGQREGRTLYLAYVLEAWLRALKQSLRQAPNFVRSAITAT